jgi:hypothetical protein
MAQAPTTWILTGSPETFAGRVRIVCAAAGVPA